MLYLAVFYHMRCTDSITGNLAYICIAFSLCQSLMWTILSVWVFGDWVIMCYIVIMLYHQWHDGPLVACCKLKIFFYDTGKHSSIVHFTPHYSFNMGPIFQVGRLWYRAIWSVTVCLLFNSLQFQSIGQSVFVKNNLMVRLKSIVS